MQATILPYVHIAVVGAPHRELAPEQLTMEDVTERQIVTGSDGMPAGIVDGEGHGFSDTRINWPGE